MYLLFSPMYLLFSTTREQVVKLFCNAGRNWTQLRLISNNSEAGVWANQLNDLMYFRIFRVCKTTLWSQYNNVACEEVNCPTIWSLYCQWGIELQYFTPRSQRKIVQQRSILPMRKIVLQIGGQHIQWHGKKQDVFSHGKVYCHKLPKTKAKTFRTWFNDTQKYFDKTFGKYLYIYSI